MGDLEDLDGFDDASLDEVRPRALADCLVLVLPLDKLLAVPFGDFIAPPVRPAFPFFVAIEERGASLLFVDLAGLDLEDLDLEVDCLDLFPSSTEERDFEAVFSPLELLGGDPWFFAAFEAGDDPGPADFLV